jgi:DNA-directed RNA polymerase specialized sigma24 family protein
MNGNSAHEPGLTAQRLAYSLKETAAMLGICEKSVRRLILRGLIRPSRALRHILIPRQEIERFLRDTC